MSDRKKIKDILKEYTEEELFDYKPNFSAEDLIKYIDSEWDIEILNMISSKINERIGYLTNIIDMGQKTVVRGFRNNED